MKTSLRERARSYALAVAIGVPFLSALAFGLWTDDPGRQKLAAVTVSALAAAAVGAITRAITRRRREDSQSLVLVADVRAAIRVHEEAAAQLRPVSQRLADLPRWQWSEDWGHDLIAEHSFRTSELEGARARLRQLVDEADKSPVGAIRRSAARLRVAFEAAQRDGVAIDASIVEEWSTAAGRDRGLRA